jgi:hypothetical protein
MLSLLMILERFMDTMLTQMSNELRNKRQDLKIQVLQDHGYNIQSHHNDPYIVPALQSK